MKTLNLIGRKMILVFFAAMFVVPFFLPENWRLPGFAALLSLAMICFGLMILNMRSVIGGLLLPLSIMTAPSLATVGIYLNKIQGYSLNSTTEHVIVFSFIGDCILMMAFMITAK